MATWSENCCILQHNKSQIEAADRNIKTYFIDRRHVNVGNEMCLGVEDDWKKKEIEKK